MANVLLVDDEPDFATAASGILRQHGHDLASVETLAEARKKLKDTPPDVLLLDLMLPDGNGLELLDELVDSGLRRVVLVTGHPGIKTLIKDLSGPSISYLTKPIDGEELLKLLEDLDEVERSSTADVRAERHFGLIVGEHPRMHAVYEQIEKVAATDASVLVVGETGVGKELVAESIHRASGREGAFVAVNCGSLSRDLAGSDLFGHEKGSFTGAMRGRRGAFRRADSGTLFLDELTEMPLELQAHFLRVLETGEVLSVGGERETHVDARIVAATNRDADGAIADRKLREDLYFRMSAFPILVPPLRERQSDIPILVNYLLAQLQPDRADRAFSEEALQRLRAYPWPGNVRELKHVVQRAVIMAGANGARIELPERFDSPFGERPGSRGVEAGRSIKEVERELIERTLEHFNGDKKATARTLGISLNTLYNRLNQYQESGTT